MSAISEKVRAGLFAKLNVLGVNSLATGGIWFQQAPEVKPDETKVEPPYLIFDRQAAGQPERAFKQTLICEDDLWAIKAYADEDSSQTLEPQMLIQNILTAAETAIGFDLTLSSGETWFVERYSDLILPKEDLSDRVVYAGGFLLRVVATG